MGSRFVTVALGVLFSLNVPGQMQLVIGDNGTTLVQKTYTRELAVGKVEMRLDSLPLQVVPESVTLSEAPGAAPARILLQRLNSRDELSVPGEEMGLTCTLDSPADGPRTFTLTYLVSGQGWQSDYNLFLRPDKKSARLEGWINISNQTSSQYDNPKIMLARSAPDVPGAYMQGMAGGYPQQMPPPYVGGVLEDSLMPLEGIAMLDRYSSTRIPLVNTPQLAITPFLECDASDPAVQEGYADQEQMPGMPKLPGGWWWIEIENHPENGLGKAMPAGSLRVFQQTDQGMVLRNTGALEAAKPGQKMRVRLTPESGLSVKKRIMQSSEGMHMDSGENRKMVLSIILKSTLDAPREVRVYDRPEGGPRRNAAISDTSDPYKTLDDGRLEFRVEVIPGTERVITYTLGM
jgi:hypothetical protein